MKLSKSDLSILRFLQGNAAISHNLLAEKVGMSRSSCWRRIKELTDIGVIQKTVALLNRKKLGLEIQAYLEVSMTEHTEETKSLFENHILSLDEVLQCFSVSGDKDYILLVATKNMESYDKFLNTHILPHPTVRAAKSTFTLREVKNSTVYSFPDL